MNNSLEQIKSRFPLKGRVTKEILDNTTDADRRNLNKCIGAKTLTEALNDESKVMWGRTRGTISVAGHCLTVGTEEDVDMMEVTESLDVTFVIKWEASM